jgi:uncharacterized membrane protein
MTVPSTTAPSAPSLAAASLAGAGAAICTPLVILLPSGEPLRVAAALLLILVIPGLALSEALSSFGRLHGPERASVVTGLSLAAAVLSSLALYAVGIRLSVASWTSCLGAITLLSCAVATLRALRSGGRRGAVAPARSRPRATTVVWFGVSVLALVASAIIAARSTTRTEKGSHFTQLWIIPGDKAGTALIGIYNHEGMSQSYSLEVRQGARVLQLIPSVDVSDIHTWTEAAPPSIGHRQLTVVIRRGGLNTPVYRRVTFTPAPV